MPAGSQPVAGRVLPHVPSRVLQAVVGLLALALLAALCAVPGLGTGVLFLVPALALLVPLLYGRYVGEATVIGLARARRTHPRRPTGRRCAPHRPRPVLLPRGGRLIAWSLAVRPPPAAPALS
jgi:hypothetical protein